MFARSFGAESSAIFQLNLAQGSAGIPGITENFDDKAVNDYEAYYHQRDLVAIRMAQSATGRAMLSTELVRESEFLDSEIFVDFARPMRLGFFWAVGGVIEVEQHVKGAIGIHRPQGTRAFEAEDKRRRAARPCVNEGVICDWHLRWSFDHRRCGPVTVFPRRTLNCSKMRARSHRLRGAL